MRRVVSKREWTISTRLGDDEVNPIKAARLFSPAKINEMQPTTSDIEAFPFLVNDISALKAEIPSYLALAADVSTTVDTLRWWENHSSDLPCWSSAVSFYCSLLLLQQRGYFLF